MVTNKIILDLYGGTGAWSKPYAEKGYDVRNITLPMFDILDPYVQEQCIKLKPHGILVAPPCTQFSFARARNTNLKNPRNLKLGMELIMACLKIIWKCQYEIEKQSAKKTTLKFWALENPNGFLKHFLGKPVYAFDPWYFGDMYKKKTHLWGWFNKPKQTFFIKPSTPKFRDMKTISDLESWKNVKTRQDKRSITPSGFAKAFFEANP
ncbi:MAG: hypothetical protein KAV87_06285 [Desulfobacteraceae bacterium]|nr:hypothetical protein [Desulfobacteraceae bacterium]